jgi:hypothetical protein
MMCVKLNACHPDMMHVRLSTAQGSRVRPPTSQGNLESPREILSEAPTARRWLSHHSAGMTRLCHHHGRRSMVRLPRLSPPWSKHVRRAPSTVLTRSRDAPPADPNSGNTYYWNPGTNVTQYERPAGAPPPLAAPVRPQPCAGGCLSLLPTPRPLTLVSHHRQTAAATAVVTVVGVGTDRCVPEAKALAARGAQHVGGSPRLWAHARPARALLPRIPLLAMNAD